MSIISIWKAKKRKIETALIPPTLVTKTHHNNHKKSYCKSVDSNQSFYVLGSVSIHRLLSISSLFFLRIKCWWNNILRAFYNFVYLRTFWFLVLIHDYLYAYRYQWLSERTNEWRKKRSNMSIEEFFFAFVCVLFSSVVIVVLVHI